MRALLLIACALLGTQLFAETVSGSGRTSVVRTPVGTSGAITSVGVVATYFLYRADGSRGSMVKLTWTENKSAGALVGNRSISFSPYQPSPSFGTPRTLASGEYTYWSGRFNAACAVEDPTNSTNYIAASPLTGHAWSFAPPNDTLQLVWRTWAAPAEGGGTDPGFTIPDPTTGYWAVRMGPESSGSSSSGGVVTVNYYSVWAGTFQNEYAWKASTLGTVPTHCRAVKAFIRVQNLSGARTLWLVWDEVVSTELLRRYSFRINFTPGQEVVQFGTRMGNPFAAPSEYFNNGMFQLYGGVFQVTGGTVGSGGAIIGGLVDSTSNFVDATPAGLPGNPATSPLYDYRDVISRFKAAYLRDHGVSSDVVATALSDTAVTNYYPSAPSGALPFTYDNAGLPQFDRCAGDVDDPDGYTGGAGSAYTGPPESAFPSSELPAGAGQATPGTGTAPGNAVQVFGHLVGSWDSFSPTQQTGKVIAFSIVLPGQSEPTQYAISSMPDTHTTQGAALNALRLVLRSFLMALILYKFFRLCYATLLKS